MTSYSENHHRRSMRLQGYDYACSGAYFVTICTQSRVCLFGEIIDDKVVLNDAGMMVQRVWDELPVRFNHIELDEFVVMPNHIHGIIVLSPPRRGESCIRPNGIHADTVHDKGEHDKGEHDKGEHDKGEHDKGEHDKGEHNKGEHDKGEHNKGEHNKGEHNKGEHNKGEHKVRPYGGRKHPCGTGDGSLGRIVQAFKSITTHEYINGVKQFGWPPFSGIVWQRNYWEHIVRDEPDLNRLREYIRLNPEKWALDTLMVAH